MSKNAENPILIVDDEEFVLQSYQAILKHNGINNILLCDDSRKVMDFVKEHNPSVILLDLLMPHIDGNELLQLIKTDYPQIPVIVVTSVSKLENAVECMKKGAFDYVAKLVEMNRFIATVKRALDMRELENEVRKLKRHVLTNEFDFSQFTPQVVARSEKMKSVLKYVDSISHSSRPVLISGEKGTGKSLIAEVIHHSGDRVGEYVSIDANELDHTEFLNALLGTEKLGNNPAAGNINVLSHAKGGTLLIKHIDSLDMESQDLLLRLIRGETLEDKYNLGNIRLITTTNIDLEKKSKDGLFRNDLYYSLVSHNIHIDPLRDRIEDIRPIAIHFIEQKIGKKVDHTTALSNDSTELLNSWSYTENAKELLEIVNKTISRENKNFLPFQILKKHLNKRRKNQSDEELHHEDLTFLNISWQGRFPKLKEVEDFLIEKAMEIAENNQTIASQLLGINQSTLSRRFHKTMQGRYKAKKGRKRKKKKTDI